MLQGLPRSFKNVLARDRWIWQQNAFDIPLLSEDDQDRLLSLPNNGDSADSFVDEWITYGHVLADKFEQERRWLEAQAYWFATSQIIVQDNKSFEMPVKEFTGIVRTGGYAAGMPCTVSSFEDIVEEGLRSLSAPVQQSILCSLLMIGTLRSSIFEDLALSNPARIAVSQGLTSFLNQVHIKWSHLFLRNLYGTTHSL